MTTSPTNDEHATTDGTDISSADAGPSFADLDLPTVLLTELDKLGYEEPTAIQAQAIPPLLAGRDLLGQAATGTGKTAAFALPMLARLAASDRDTTSPFGLVIVPTRELAMQVSEAIHTYGRGMNARVLPVYGGAPIGKQIQRLKRGVDIVVATPGRAVDHLSRRTMKLDALELVVLDEADEMLDMGFAEDLDAILDATPEFRQTALFSATMPGRVATIAKRYMLDPLRITIERGDAGGLETPQIREQVVVTQRHHKAAALTRMLDVEDPTATLVFCRTRNDVDELTRTMNGRGYRAQALHGGMNQSQRERVMESLRDGSAELLIATDVAARGLDVELLTHVVNYSLPSQPESYVHRIGRVGRAGREGVAITLVEPRETRALQAIERHVGRTLEVTPVPTIADLRERRVEQLTDRVREAMQREDLDRGLNIFDRLGDDEDAQAVAVAALAVLYDDVAGDDDETDVPQFDLQRGGNKKSKKDRGPSSGGGGGSRNGGGRDSDDGAGRASYVHKDGDTAKVWLSVGRNVGVRPKDIVGAVAGETSLSGKDIGNVSIMGRFTLVEVPAASVDEVVTKMRQATVRGKNVHAKPDRAD